MNLEKETRTKNTGNSSEATALIEAQAMLAKMQKEQAEKDAKKTEKDDTEDKPEEKKPEDKPEEKKPEKPVAEAPISDTTDLEPDIDKTETQ